MNVTLNNTLINHGQSQNEIQVWMQHDLCNKKTQQHICHNSMKIQVACRENLNLLQNGEKQPQNNPHNHVITIHGD